jgi:hypothetical protein
MVFPAAGDAILGDTPDRLIERSPPACIYAMTRRPLVAVAFLAPWLAAAGDIPLPPADPGPFAPVPGKIAGPQDPAKAMEPQPPRLEDCKNAAAILQELKIRLTPAQQAELDRQRFLLVPVELTALGEALPQSEEDAEWAFTMDEMLSAFSRLGGHADPTLREPANAKLVTPDIVLHAWHRGFARTLEYIEQRRLHQVLETFLAGALGNARALRAAAEGPAAERLAWAEARFAAPWVLLGPPAPKDADPYEEEKQPAPVPYAEAVKSRLATATKGLPPAVAKALTDEVTLAMAADGMEISPLFGRYTPGQAADYSQFKPRSHYTKSDALGGYFRAMMFLGRTSYDFRSSEAYGDAALAALIMARTPEKGEAPLAAWKQLMEITGFFAGQSDDITYAELRAWIAETLGTPALAVGTALSPDTAAKLAANLAKLRAPQIVSSVHLDTDTSPDAEPPAFRICGQRFTWDARILDRFTRGAPQAMPSLPTALMIPAAFGDAYALKRVRDGLSPEHRENFDQRLPEVRQELAAVTDAQWFSSMAAKQLQVIGALARPRHAHLPAYMQGEAFAAKNLESQIGSFTQLKHDTVLYAKQVYAEAGEGGLDDKAPPVVKGFVQPDLVFWREMERLATFAADGFARHRLFPDADEEFSRFRVFATQVRDLRQIAEKLAAGGGLTEAEWETIRNADFSEMARPLVPYDEPKPGDGKCALVTDIVTDAASGQILFQALGRPFVMLALVGGKDGARMVAGLAYHHHEFARPLSAGRMTDEEWRARIYRAEPKLPERAPWQVPVARPEPLKPEAAE